MASGRLETPINLYISCKDLRDVDVTSKSDPMVTLLQHDRHSDTWHEVGKTETVKNTLNPSFATPIKITYSFEEVQKLEFRVYDVDTVTQIDTLLGSAETTLGSLVGNQTTKLPLKLPHLSRGSIMIVAEQGSETGEMATFNFHAKNLDKKDFLGKSDPYLQFERALPNGQFLTVHRTEFIKNNLNPTWKPFSITSQQLCGGNEEQELKVSCFDYDSDGSHDLIGIFTTTWKEMKEALSKEIQWECISPKKKSKKKYVNSGIVYLSKLKIEKLHSFFEFVSGGCQMHFTVGIDFTASNGEPNEQSSLHYISPYQPNEYMKALVAVGSVCEQYDSDKLFPAFGFGAEIPPDGKVSHEFALNFNPSNPYCEGIMGVTAAYQAAIPKVNLLGPTNVSPIINHVAEFAQAAAESGKADNYFILLLLTDGAISDMALTRSAIIEASSLPMSIIIVGVGSANFSAMRELDSDESRLEEDGKKVARDIVQFVPFTNYSTAPPADLARDVLGEVPGQVVEYFRMKGLPPMERSATH